MDNNGEKVISIENFIDLYPKLTLKNEESNTKELLKYFNIKNKIKNRKNSIIMESTHHNKKTIPKTSTNGLSNNLKDNNNSVNAILDVDKNKNSAIFKETINSKKSNDTLYKIRENEDIDECINLENEDLFLIHKDLELKKRGLRRTYDIKKALELFFYNSELIAKLSEIFAMNRKKSDNNLDNKENNKKIGEEENIILKDKNYQFRIKTIISKLADNVVFEKFEKNIFIVKMDDIGKDCYFLISGRLSVLKPVEYKNIEITYDDYFKYLLNLLDKEENGLLKKVLKLNWHFINIYDEANLMALFKYYIQNRISVFSNVTYNSYEKEKEEDLSLEKIEKFLSEFKMTFRNFDLSKEIISLDIHDIIINCENEKKDAQSEINEYFREIFKPSKETQILLNSYNYMFEKNNNNNSDKNKNSVTLLKYEIFKILEPGAFFGEISQENENKKRNVTIRTEEDSILVSLSNEQYENLLLDDNKKWKIARINFICSNYFFNKISTILFEKYYYPMFKLITKKKDDIIFRQESICDTLFLLKEGIIKYEIYGSIVDLHELMCYLIESLKENECLKLDKKDIKEIKKKYLINNKLITFSTSNIILKEKIVKKYKFELSISDTYEFIGIYEFFLKIGHISTCHVSSKTAKFFEISSNALGKIITIEKNMTQRYHQFILNKLLALIKRLFCIENQHIKGIQDKIKSNFFDINDTRFYINLNSTEIPNFDKIKKMNEIEEKNDLNIKKDYDINEGFNEKDNRIRLIRKKIIDFDNYNNNSSSGSSSRIIDLIKMNNNKNISKEKEREISHSNSKKSNYKKSRSIIDNNICDVKLNSSTIINAKKNNEMKNMKNSESFINDKINDPANTIINLGNNYFSLPQLKRKILLNRYNMENSNNKRYYSIVKNVPINNYSLFHNSLCRSSSKRDQGISVCFNQQDDINYKDNNILPILKKSESSRSISFLNKMKKKLVLTKIKNNLEPKINHNKKISIEVVEEKKNHVLVEVIKNYYRNKKIKGYSAIFNPIHNTILRRKKCNNLPGKEKE